MIIKFYCVIIFLTCTDEIWNIKNPRPFPKKRYYIVQWEEKDFYTFKIDDKCVLRKYRKTDDETKRIIRNQYWEKRNGI